jgi:hypothetical protein
MVLYLIEELAARAFNATYYSLAGKKRRVAVVLAYFAYYATMSALLMLYAFTIMMVFSATLFLLDPSLYELAAQSQWIPPIHLFFMFSTHLISEGAETIIVKSWRGEIRELYGRFKDAFEENGLLREFVAVLDRINSTLAVAERCQPPPVIIRTLVHDDLRMLDDFAREYRGYVGKVMDHVCRELRSLLYEVFEECEDFGGER